MQKYISGLLMDERQDGFRAIFDYEPNNVDSYQGILQILASARVKKATKPKDKIFALFGVMKELEVDLPLPDYQKSLEQIYTEAANRKRLEPACGDCALRGGEQCRCGSLVVLLWSPHA